MVDKLRMIENGSALSHLLVLIPQMTLAQEPQPVRVCSDRSNGPKLKHLTTDGIVSFTSYIINKFISYIV